MQDLADAEGLCVPPPEVTDPPDKPKLTDLELFSVDPEELKRGAEEGKRRLMELFGA